MAIPTAYTEDSLKAYMLSVLEDVGAQFFEWTPDNFNEQVIQTLLWYGNVRDVAGATDLVKLRALAAYTAWLKAWGAAVALEDFEADGGNFKQSQIFKQIGQRLLAAWGEAYSYLPAGTLPPVISGGTGSSSSGTGQIAPLPVTPDYNTGTMTHESSTMNYSQYQEDQDYG